MHERFTCDWARPNNHIVESKLTFDPGAPGQPSTILINGTSEVFPETFMHGDVWDVKLTLVSRVNANGTGNV